MMDNQESPSKELLPCPFCGGEAEIEQQGTGRISTIYSCLDCGCRLETGETWQVPSQWNQRKQLTTTQQALDSAVEALEKIQKTNDFHGFADFTALRALKKLKRTDSLQRIKEAQKELSDV